MLKMIISFFRRFDDAAEILAAAAPEADCAQPELARIWG